MNHKQFKQLQIGDKVKLLTDQEVYYDYYMSKESGLPRESFIIPAGTVGVVGAVMVASVTGQNGHYFHCVDFPYTACPGIMQALNSGIEQTGYFHTKEWDGSVAMHRTGCFPKDIAV